MKKKNLTNKKVYWINIGSGEETKVIEIAKKITKIIKYNCKFKFNLKKPDGVKTKLMNISLSKKLGWKPKIRLDEGLFKTVNWFKNNNDLV